MATFTTLKRKDNKAFFARIPTRKHTLSLAVYPDGSSVDCYGTYWDEGSRSSYVILTAAGKIEAISTPTAPTAFGGSPSPLVPIPDGGVIIKGGISRGKSAHLLVYIQEKDVERLTGKTG